MNDFKYHLDIDIEKSQTDPTDESRYDNMIFFGVASDNSRDAEEESLDPNGFVFDRFLKHGLINLDHLTTRSPINKSRFWIGEPLEAYVKDGKFYVKGKLWKKSPEARVFWDKVLEMKASGSTRKPGMSVEGKALVKNKQTGKVSKALITNLALTMTPVNPSTWFDLVKSIAKEDDYHLNSELNPISTILLEYETNGKVIQIDKDFKILVKDSCNFNSDSFWDLYKRFEQNEISKKVLEDFVESNKNKFKISK